MAQLKEGSIIKKSAGDEVIATVKDIPTDLSQLNQDENNRLLTDELLAKLNQIEGAKTVMSLDDTTDDGIYVIGGQ